MTWNFIVALGIAINLVALALGRGARQASAASLELRYRWLIRLTLGFGAVLLLALLVALARFGLAMTSGGASTESRAFLLAVCIASGFNLVLGFVAFGTLPTLVAFMVARRLKT